MVKDNSFYMVAPFLGPLKAWIKAQRRQDRQRAHIGSHLVPPPTAGITDTEGLEADLGETTADEAALPERLPEDANFAALVANLGRGQRASDALPEVSTLAQTQGVVDPAAELKRLLSVGGMGFPLPTQPAEAPQPIQEPPQNPLLAMLHGNNRPAQLSDNLPRTPFEQMLPTPQPPHSPHGQHHPRPPHLGQMQPPPPFPFHQQQGGAFHGQQQHHPMPPQHQHHNGFPPPPPNEFTSPPAPRQANPLFQAHAPNAQQSFNTTAPPPYQRTGDPQFAQTSQYPSAHGPVIPPASKLPPPKLTAHTLGLLNAFKINEKPAISSPVTQQSSQATPIATRPPPLQRQPDSFASPPSEHNARPYEPSPPAFQSPPPIANFEPVQPKPRNAHQDSLLSLFRSPSIPAASPAPAKTPELPVELSAYPSTPGIMKLKTAETVPPMPDMNAKPNLLDIYNTQQKPGLTTATVRGPVNAPDFDTVKKNAHHPLNGTSRGPSPSLIKPEPKMFVPQQILRRESSLPRTNAPAVEQSRSSNASPATTLPSAAPFKPQILKRPQQPPTQESIPGSSVHAQGLLNLFKTQTPPQPQANTAPVPPSRSPAPPASMTSSLHRKEVPAEQKSALLSLFGKPSAPLTASPTQARSPLATSTTSPIPPARSPHPPTPKTIMSGVISPVSPLPGSQVESPSQLNSRSRISSIGDTMPPSIVIPPTSAPMSVSQLPFSQQSNGFGTSMDGNFDSSTSASVSELGVGIDKGKGKAGTDSNGKSPVDKTFLLGFLNDVARKGR